VSTWTSTTELSTSVGLDNMKEIVIDDVLPPFISVIDTGDAMIVASAGFGHAWCRDELGIEIDTVPDVVEPVYDCDLSYLDEKVSDVSTIPLFV